MKIVVIIIFVIGYSSLASAQRDQKQMILAGVIKGIGNSKIFIGSKGFSFTSGTRLTYIDSVISCNDTFQIIRHFDEPNLYSLEVPLMSKGWVSIILDNINLEVHGTIDTIWKSRVSGSLENDLMKFYRAKILSPLAIKQNLFAEKADSLRKLNDTINADRCRDSIRTYGKLISSVTLNFIKNHPDNFTSLYLLSKNIFRYSDKIIKQYFNLLNSNLKNFYNIPFL